MVRLTSVLALALLAPLAATAAEQVAAVPPAKPPVPERPALPPPGAETAACLDGLRDMGVAFRRLSPLEAGPDGACGTEVPLRVSGLPGGVAVRPAATLTCAMTRALADWTRDGLIPAAQEELDKTPTALRVAGSYVCRTVNGAPRGKLSQHAHANAIDIAGFDLQDTGVVPVNFRGNPALPPRTARARFQRTLRRAACDRFMTVIGPGGDAFHGDHFHFDMSPRPSGAKVCD